MKLGVLFSGGKDSCLALYKAMQKEEVVCLISIISKNPESFMFHVPNIHITQLQAQAIGLPLIRKITEGKKEEELKDLKSAIKEAKQKYRIEGIVTGAIESIYQASRIQKICNELDLWCFNPLWKRDQIELLKELIKNRFKVIISGVFAYPFDEKMLGMEINNKAIEILKKFEQDFEINPAGEGGEIETTVLDAPFFKKKIKILESEKKYEKNSGVLIIKKAELVEKC